MGDRYLYKLGGTTDIGKVEMLDLEKVTLGGTKSCYKQHDFSPIKDAELVSEL